MKYPAAIVSEDYWGVLIKGHGVSLEQIERAEAELNMQLRPGAVRVVDEVWYYYKPRLKWCDRVTGWGCDQLGEWHSHWFAAREGYGTALTEVHHEFVEELECVNAQATEREDGD